MSRHVVLALVLVLMLTLSASVLARNPIRREFFNLYPAAEYTTLDDVTSNPGHCGVCHFDFDGGGQRNPYGVSIEAGLNGGLSNEQAILAIELNDSDNDGFINLVEITDVANYTNTPTFPGLKESNLGQVLNVSTTDIEDYLTPVGALDEIDPVVSVLAPDGGESLPANVVTTISWTATDNTGVSHVDIAFSEDGGASWKPVATDLPNDGAFDWHVHNYPGPNTLVRVQAYDYAGNEGSDQSASTFTITPVPGAVVPTSLRDFEMSGTQPHEGAIFEDPAVTCVACHGDFSPETEPWYNWRGSMMGNAMRDPLYMSLVRITDAAAPGGGDLCLRCHTPGGWQEGRSTDTTGGMINAKDRQGVQCDYCHSGVDVNYVAGVSPAADEAILNNLAVVPLDNANGQFVSDPDPVRRGPYEDAQASHQFIQNPFTLSSDICGTCHDVSNPVFVAGAAPGEYDVQALDAPHPDNDRRNMFPVERTYSEWSASEYAATGVYAPQFAGLKPDGIVSTCQDCHMADVSGRGADGGPVRSDIGLHDFTGGNHFIPDILADYFPGEVDQAALADGKARAIAMLQKAALLDVVETGAGGQRLVTVTVTNDTGHKLPSGYPEGRRIWLNVKAYDAGLQMVYESGAYDAATGELAHDADVKIYQIKPGRSERLASLLGVSAGPSFNMALNDTVYSDNRIPPRGFTNAAFTAIQSPPVDYTYADGQYWDETVYALPIAAASVEVTLYYQTTSKEFIEFLRDNDPDVALGQQLYDAWVAHGRAAPVVMATASLDLVLTGVDDEVTPRATCLEQNMPNPFNPSTKIRYTLADAGRVSLRVYDERGRMVRELLAAVRPAGAHELVWDATDDRGRRVSSGAYFYVLRAGDDERIRKMTVVK
jgi:hypothetical protein